MAPTKTPRRPKPESDYGNVGVKGRRTGIVLKDTGVRDEHGLEPIEGIFSSPQKPFPKQNGATQYSTITEDDSMDTGDSSTMPGPADILQGSRNGKVSLPPRSRTPIKTSLGSSPRRTPRRSVGPTSSPSQLTNKSTPTRAALNPPNRTSIGFHNEEVKTAIEVSVPNGQNSRPKRPNTKSTNGKGIKRVFDLSLAEDDDDDDEDHEQDENGLSILSNGAIQDSGVLSNDDNQVPLVDDDDFPEAEEKQPFNESAEAENISEATEALLSTTSVPKNRVGRPPKARPANHDSLISPDDSQNITAQSKQRGRRKKEIPGARSDDAHGSSQDIEDENIEDLHPRKKRKGSKTVVPRKLNIQMKPPSKPKNKSTLEKLTAEQTQRTKPNSRSTYTERHETPADPGARRTRAGRTIVGPVAFWRGERIVYGDGNIDGSILTLPGIKEIIRTEEVEVPRPPKRPVYKRSKSKRQLKVEDEEESVDDERELWETETGIVTAQVMQWDPVAGRYDEENTESTDIAYAAEAIEMRNISGAEFKFAKTLTLPFFGSGMVDLPPGGAKRVKNSRKMQMVFFVFYGRVTVDVGTPTTSFSIGKGGMWQVPRGNFYSITNLSETKDARIFFAQGCEVAQDMGYDESQAA